RKWRSAVSVQGWLHGASIRFPKVIQRLLIARRL
ncbi:hypothetical protein PTTW11_10752, partial [Pyrenophora teres f. teres]